MRMIAIVDRTPDAETPLKGIEEIPEGTDPDDVFKEHLVDYDGSAQMGYIFIHPAFGAMIQASEVPDWSWSSAITEDALNQYRFELCKMIEVESDFSITELKLCTSFYLGLKNKWVAMAAQS